MAIELENDKSAYGVPAKVREVVIAPPAPASIVLPDTDDVRELAAAATPHCIRCLADIVVNSHVSPSVRIAASTALLDRGHGKPHQSSTVNGNMQLTIVCAIPATPNSQPTIIEN